MRLIDADALKERLKEYCIDGDEQAVQWYDIMGIDETIDNAPTIDAVPVVQCKDCKHFADDYVDTGFGPIPAFSCDVCELYGVGLSLNHYCSCGEREDDE